MKKNRGVLERAIAEASPQHARLLTGFVLEGKTLEALAEHHNLPVGVLRTRLRLALKLLDRSLRKATK